MRNISYDQQLGVAADVILRRPGGPRWPSAICRVALGGTGGDGAVMLNRTSEYISKTEVDLDTRGQLTNTKRILSHRMMSDPTLSLQRDT